MKNKRALQILFAVLFAGLMTLLASCGGGGGGYGGGGGSTSYGGTPPPPAGSSPPTSSGLFVDAPVCGLNYTTSSGYSGITDVQGQFRFTPGDTVSFRALGVTLGSYAPPIAADGSATVTPLNLVVGATSVADARVTAIGQFLNTLNALSTAQGSGRNGIFVVPTGTGLQTALTALNTTAPNLTATQLQSALDSAYGAGKFTVVATTAAQAALQQGANSQGVIGTVWKGICTCGGGGQFFFQSDGTLNGFTNDGKLLSGTWTASTVTGGGVSLSLFSSGGGYSKNALIAAGASTGTADIYSSTGVLQGTFMFSKAVSATTLASSAFGGGWYASFTATPASNGNGSAYFIAAPDGTFTADTNDGKVFSGTWNVTTGQGTGTFTSTSGMVNNVSVDFSAGTGSVSSSGTVVGTLTLTRTGTFSVTPPSPTATGVPIPLLLNMVTSWANLPNTTNSIAVSLSVADTTGAQIAFGNKSTSEPPNFSGVRTTTTDNIAVSYPQGAGKTYSVSVGQQNCTVSGGSGTVNDANSGNASAYPTVYITCDPNALPAPPIPLLLNMVVSWANTAQSVNSFALTMSVSDATGKQIANTVKTASEGSLITTGIRSTTTDNVAVSYTKGAGSTYQLSIAPGQTAATQCSFTGGASGVVVDANSGNAAAYPTVTITCN